MTGDRRPEERLIEPLEYPFDLPTGPTLWRLQNAVPLDLHGDLEALLGGRRPVLAVGSNASSEQLDRKFARSGAADDSETLVPIVPATVDGLDVVYAAWVSSYGSVPATVTLSRGSTAHVFINWLTPRQLEHMDRSEGPRYRRVNVEGVTSLGQRPKGVTCYVFAGGALTMQDLPVGLAEVKVDRGANPRLSQRQLWDRIAGLVGPGMAGAELCHAALADGRLLHQVRTWLADSALSAAGL